MNNNCSLRVSLDGGCEGKGLAVLDGARIKGHVQTDQEFIGVFMEVVRRISN